MTTRPLDVASASLGVLQSRSEGEWQGAVWTRHYGSGRHTGQREWAALAFLPPDSHWLQEAEKDTSAVTLVSPDAVGSEAFPPSVKGQNHPMQTSSGPGPPWALFTFHRLQKGGWLLLDRNPQCVRLLSHRRHL